MTDIKICIEAKYVKQRIYVSRLNMSKKECYVKKESYFTLHWNTLRTYEKSKYFKKKQAFMLTRA